ncbi:hypothetical protein B0T19DRAFT_482577 [Cercophora scortea]|uniref:Uncharacterized protein n=1 Tax=Cercophora scortea TaxID=314031 RepID=A0AAE0MIG0_9PEZI|nr:hypothetical protein B0T19DRAFT_482577 [Cercophora scortea]
MAAPPCWPREAGASPPTLGLPVSPTRKVGKASHDDIFFSSPPATKSPADDSTESQSLTTTDPLYLYSSAASDHGKGTAASPQHAGVDGHGLDRAKELSYGCCLDISSTIHERRECLVTSMRGKKIRIDAAPSVVHLQGRWKVGCADKNFIKNV